MASHLYTDTEVGVYDSRGFLVAEFMATGFSDPPTNL